MARAKLLTQFDVEVFVHFKRMFEGDLVDKNIATTAIAEETGIPTNLVQRSINRLIAMGILGQPFPDVDDDTVVIKRLPDINISTSLDVQAISPGDRAFINAKERNLFIKDSPAIQQAMLSAIFSKRRN